MRVFLGICIWLIVCWIAATFKDYYMKHNAKFWMKKE